jgi:VWFA-related protein
VFTPALILGFAVLGAVSGAAAGDAGKQPTDLPPQPYVERLDVSLVLVPVVVRDKQGRPVIDLDESDFTVLDEGEVRKLTAFGRENRRVSVVLALDTSPSMKPYEHSVKLSALEFIRGQSADTRFSLITFNDGVFLEQDFTLDRKATENAIGAVRLGGDSTSLFDSVDAAARHLEGEEGARVVVLFTDGTDTVHPLDQAESRVRSGVEAALKRDVTAFTVAFGQRAAKGLLRRIAEETGGEALTASTARDLRAAFAHVAESVGSRYLLGFASPSDAEPGFRKIEVKISRPGVRISARSRYHIN